MFRDDDAQGRRKNTSRLVVPFAAAANWPAACSCSSAAAAGLGAVAAFRACVCAWDDE